MATHGGRTVVDATWDAGEEALVVGDAHWKLWSVPTDAVWSTPSIGRSLGGEIPDSDDHPEARLVRALRDALVERDKFAETIADLDARLTRALDERDQLRAEVARDAGWARFSDEEPEPHRPVLVTNNITARTRQGQMSHLWLTSCVQSKPGGEFLTFAGDIQVRFLTHWRYALPEGCDD